MELATKAEVPASSQAPTLQGYWDALKAHDWYSDYSDDHGVWMRGVHDMRRLINWSMHSPEHKALFEGFKAHWFCAATADRPALPERPA